MVTHLEKGGGGTIEDSTWLPSIRAHVCCVGTLFLKYIFWIFLVLHFFCWANLQSQYCNLNEMRVNLVTDTNLKSSTVDIYIFNISFMIVGKFKAIKLWWTFQMRAPLLTAPGGGKKRKQLGRSAAPFSGLPLSLYLLPLCCHTNCLCSNRVRTNFESSDMKPCFVELYTTCKQHCGKMKSLLFSLGKLRDSWDFFKESQERKRSRGTRL